jgi:acetamidase/formamidase
VAADLRIHEVVDAPNWMVGAFLPDDIFRTQGARIAPPPAARHGV